MLRNKTIKKRTKNRLTLLRNLQKGKARLEPRCAFQMIPYPLKFSYGPQQMHQLYGDVILMEHHDTVVTETSLLNHFKVFKHAQLIEYQSTKLIKVLVENKGGAPSINWHETVEKFRNSESSHIRSWVDPVKAFCERHERLLKEVEDMYYNGCSSQRLQFYKEMTEKTFQMRQNLNKIFPCIEVKSQIKDGRFQITELIYNEKFLNEIGHSLESFSSSIFQEGLPRLIPFESNCGSLAAKLRLDKHLVVEKEGYQSEDVETCLIMKSGYMKKVKLRFHYHSSFEKELLGFNIFATIVAKQKPFIDVSMHADHQVNKDFVRLMSNKEEEMTNFLSLYYNKAPELIYTNLDKVCKIKEISDPEEIL